MTQCSYIVLDFGLATCTGVGGITFLGTSGIGYICFEAVAPMYIPSQVKAAHPTIGMSKSHGR